MLADTSVVVACLILYSHGHRWLDIPGRTIQCETDRADHKDPWLLSPPFDLAYHASCYSNRNEGRFDLGRYLERTLTPQQTYVLGDTGIAPYLSHANVIDSFCLNSPELTRPPISYDTRRFIDSIFERAPDVIVMHGYNGSQYSPLNDETNFYKTLAGDPRFRARYQRKPGSPVFHAHTFAGEAWYSYWIFEKKP